AVDPVAGRIGNTSGLLAHFAELPSGVPVKVSKVPRPLLMLLESGIGAPSASLKDGPAGRCGCAAMAQTLVRAWATLVWPLLICWIISGGMPQETWFFLTKASIFSCETAKAVSSLQASGSGTLAFCAAITDLPCRSASSRSLTKSFMHDGSCCCCRGG